MRRRPAPTLTPGAHRGCIDLGRDLTLYVYNAVDDAVRHVTIVPDYSWGGDGCLGCGIGFGLMHRIPDRAAREELRAMAGAEAQSVAGADAAAGFASVDLAPPSPRASSSPSSAPAPAATVPAVVAAPPVSAPAAAAPALVGTQDLRPAWLRNGLEPPQATIQVGSYAVGVFTAEQQARLGVDEQGNFVTVSAPVAAVDDPAAAPAAPAASVEPPALAAPAASEEPPASADAAAAVDAAPVAAAATPAPGIGGDAAAAAPTSPATEQADTRPAWMQSGLERPAGLKAMGTFTIGVYTAEQQARLGVDELGNRQPRGPDAVEQNLSPPASPATPGADTFPSWDSYSLPASQTPAAS